jgi:hypothetical protein
MDLQKFRTAVSRYRETMSALDAAIFTVEMELAEQRMDLNTALMNSPRQRPETQAAVTRTHMGINERERFLQEGPMVKRAMCIRRHRELTQRITRALKDVAQQ